jgi:hypothetical protein
MPWAWPRARLRRRGRCGTNLAAGSRSPRRRWSSASTTGTSSTRLVPPCSISWPAPAPRMWWSGPGPGRPLPSRSSPCGRRDRRSAWRWPTSLPPSSKSSWPPFSAGLSTGLPSSAWRGPAGATSRSCVSWSWLVWKRGRSSTPAESGTGGARPGPPVWSIWPPPGSRRSRPPSAGCWSSWPWPERWASPPWSRWLRPMCSTPSRRPGSWRWRRTGAGARPAWPACSTGRPCGPPCPRSGPGPSASGWRRRWRPRPGGGAVIS